MIKGILRIALLSTVIFFTAQLGWSATTPPEDPNNASGRSGGSATEAATLAVGANYDCPNGTCHKNSFSKPLWTNTTYIPGGTDASDSNTSGGSN